MATGKERVCVFDGTHCCYRLSLLRSAQVLFRLAYAEGLTLTSQFFLCFCAYTASLSPFSTAAWGPILSRMLVSEPGQHTRSLRREQQHTTSPSQSFILPSHRMPPERTQPLIGIFNLVLKRAIIMQTTPVQVCDTPPASIMAGRNQTPVSREDR